MTKHHREAFASFALAALVACEDGQLTYVAPEEPPVVEDPCVDPARARSTPECMPPYEGTHAIDRVLHPIFFREGIQFVPAGETELCRRLTADLLGHLPTMEEIQTECRGRDVETIARDFQTRDDYLLTSERHWRDRFDTDDIVVDWRYLKELYFLVDELHLGRLPYAIFAEKVLSHPGFVMTEFLPEDMSRHAFRSFLGREATDAEAADLAALYRMWVPAQERDPDFTYVYTIRTYLLPSSCGALSTCSSKLFGGAEVALQGIQLRDYIRWEELDEIDRDVLAEVGRLFARQPFFWEAAADEILNRLLGWSDGGRFPREVGVLLPEVRQVVAEYLRTTGDYPGAERMVLTSWLYRQTAIVEPDGLGDDPAATSLPVYAFGPVKAASAEVWMNTIAPLTYLDIGTCDPRYPDYYPFFQMYAAYDQGMISVEQLAADLRALHDMQQNRGYFGPGQSGYDEPLYYYTYYARLLGGCPGFQSERQEPSGLSFGFQQETFAEIACATGTAQNTDPGVRPFVIKDVFAHQMRYLFGREPIWDETRAVLDAYAHCTDTDCTDEGVARSICTALAGSAEMLFY